MYLVCSGDSSGCKSGDLVTTPPSRPLSNGTRLFIHVPQLFILAPRFLVVHPSTSTPSTKDRLWSAGSVVPLIHTYIPLVRYLSDHDGAAFQSCVKDTTAAFGNCSAEVRAVEATLSDEARGRPDLAGLLRSIQARDREGLEKSYLTADKADS